MTTLTDFDFVLRLCQEWKSCLTCVVVGWLTFKVSKFYWRVLSLPKGPTPLPLIGNILTLRGSKQNNAITFAEMAKEYGPMFTFWVGYYPVIVLSDLDISKETFKKAEFSDRLSLPMIETFKGKNNERCDVVMDQFGPRWESNRRAVLAGVRKYAMSEQLSALVFDVMDEVVKDIFKNEGVDKPFDTEKYIQTAFVIILFSSVFGKRCSIIESELIQFVNFLEVVNDPRFFFYSFLPFLRKFYSKPYEQIENGFKANLDFMRMKFEEHEKDFDENQIRDFCDALLLAKQESIADAKESAQYLTVDNLNMAVFDMFFAGSDTMQKAVRWFILYMTNYPEYQRKMREEVASVIGDRMPVQKDRNNCHLVNAFLHETLRIRPTGMFSVPHKAMVDAKIGDHSIPKDTLIIQNIYAIHHDPNNFPDPEQFRPERFLDPSGCFTSQKPAAFIPFGVGRRYCLGEKIAIAEIFLVVINLIQKTSGYEFGLRDGPGSACFDVDPGIEVACTPKKFEVVLTRR